MAAVLVTRTVPEPVIVPAGATGLMTTAESGVKTTPEAIVSVRVPPASRLKFFVVLKPLVLLIFTLLKPRVAVDVPLMEVAAAGLGVLKSSVFAVIKENGVAAEVLTIQFPRNVCVDDVPPSKLANPEIVRSPLTVRPAAAVFALVLESVRW